MLILRAWIADWPTDHGEASGLVTIAMRFKKEAHVPTTQYHVFPRSREDHTLENHVSFGLFEQQSLFTIRDAINVYLKHNGLE